MYHQFRELANVDITKEAMEVGPTCHYVMGGVRVDADTEATNVPGLFAAGEVAAGLHGANRLGGNSLSDLLVFGRRAGLYAAEYAKNLSGPLTVNPAELEERAQAMVKPFDDQGQENPYTIHSDLQECMQNLVGIIRNEADLKKALDEIEALKQRLAKVKIQGNRQYNPAWHLTMDLHSMLTVSRATTLSAIERKESRGGHTRDDYPKVDPNFAKVNVVIQKKSGDLLISQEPLPDMPEDLKKLVEEQK
jgi:succinate dehydrogenase / fumarate reductase flavoprotein subunit